MSSKIKHSIQWVYIKTTCSPAEAPLIFANRSARLDSLNLRISPYVSDSGHAFDGRGRLEANRFLPGKTQKPPAEKPGVDLTRLCFLRNDLFLVVRSASLANSVRHHKRAALAALYKIRSSHLPVCSATVSSCLGMFILRTNSTHRLHLLDHYSAELTVFGTRMTVLYRTDGRLSTTIFENSVVFHARAKARTSHSPKHNRSTSAGVISCTCSSSVRPSALSGFQENHPATSPSRLK